MVYSPIIHKWFYPEGPDTFEYPLPVEQFIEGHDSRLPEWTRSFASLSLTDANQAFGKHINSIAHPDISAFTSVCESLVPYSIVVCESYSWLLCKLQDQFDESSAHGNMLQLPAPHLDAEWPTVFDSENFTSLRRFLKYFGGTRIDMPPTCGPLTPEKLQPVTEDLDTYAWKNIGIWKGAYPVYNVGNGDVVLVRSDGTYGIWCHELGDEPNGAVNDLGSFGQFIEFVAKETGITR